MSQEEEIVWDGESFSRELMIFALKYKTPGNRNAGTFSTYVTGWCRCYQMLKVFTRCPTHLNLNSSPGLKGPHDSAPTFLSSLILYHSPSFHCIPITLTPFLWLKHIKTIPASEPMPKLSPSVWHTVKIFTWLASLPSPSFKG